MKTLNYISYIIFLLLFSSITHAKDLSISNPYVREVPPGQINSATFLSIKNDSDKDIALIKAISDVAKHVELHEHVHKDGMMQMRQVKQIDIPAHSTTILKPGGYHVMLIGLTRKIKSGDIIDVELQFDNGDKKAIKAEVKKVMRGMLMKKNMKPDMKMGGNAINKAHFNPMPNLMQIFKEMPEILSLSSKQTAALQKGVDKRQPKIQELFEKVNKLEQEINQAVLDDEPLSTIDQLATKIVQIRLGIINMKAACAETAQSIMNKEQFAKLQSTYKEKFAKKRQYTEDMKGKMAMQKHLNPLPNLMIVIDKMTDKLNLSKEQLSKLKQWQKERAPIMNRQYKTILKFENNLQDAALNNAAPEKLAELADAIMQNRIKVIRGRAFTREKIADILKPEQFQKVLKLYKENFMVK